MLPNSVGERLHNFMDIISSIQNIGPDLTDVLWPPQIWKCIPMAVVF